MEMLPNKAKDKKTYAGRHSKGLTNQNGGHLVNLCKSNILKAQVNLFPVKKQKLELIAHHRVVGDERIRQGISLMNAC